MEDHSPNIVATIEPVEEVEDQVAEPEEVPEHSILKPKPKKPRTQAQKVSFARCQAARRLKLAAKTSSAAKVKNMPVEKPVEKSIENPVEKSVKKTRKKRQPTIIDLNKLSDSEGDEEGDEIIYVKKKRKKRKRVVKYVETSSSDEDYGPDFQPQEQYDSSLNDYYNFV
jgi:hypothetical protein